MNLPQPPDRWDINLLTEERTAAVSAFGFTPREARFLVEVLIHSGVFVERQYCAFAGRKHGHHTTDFLRRLVERGYARPIATGAPHRGRLFHVQPSPEVAALVEGGAQPGERAVLEHRVQHHQALDHPAHRHGRPRGRERRRVRLRLTHDVRACRTSRCAHAAGPPALSAPCTVPGPPCVTCQRMIRGHHDVNRRAVLAGVQASVLRTDRNAAAGLDRGCAQRLDRALT